MLLTSPFYSSLRLHIIHFILLELIVRVGVALVCVAAAKMAAATQTKPQGLYFTELQTSIRRKKEKEKINLPRSQSYLRNRVSSALFRFIKDFSGETRFLGVTFCALSFHKGFFR